MVRMTPESKRFLEKNLPNALETDSVRQTLLLLFDWIEDHGFAPPHYDEYNDLGREAQRVYDDIYLSSLSEEELEKYRIKE